MRVSFGWHLDRAPWHTGDDGQTMVVTGPLGLLGLLQTRLGLSHPTVDRSLRIAQYRSLMTQADHPWYQKSFDRDPWNTARHFLGMRDDLIEAGWNPGGSVEDYDQFPRIGALAAVERLVRVGFAGDDDANLRPGRGDDVQEVCRLLADLPNESPSDPGWSMGIDSIEIRDEQRDVPHAWRELLEAVHRHGVLLSTADSATAAPRLTIARGGDEWTTAEAAARWLSSVKDPETLCIVAGDDTAILDAALSLREMPTLGVSRSTSMSPAGQVLPIFLNAILPPVSAHQVADLLRFTFGTSSSSAKPAALVARRESWPLLKALSREPGFSSDPQSAWWQALNGIEESEVQESPPRSTAGRQEWTPLTFFLELARTSDIDSPHFKEADRVVVESLDAPLDWLGDRLRRLARRPSTGAGSEDDGITALIADAAGHLLAFRRALSAIGSTEVSLRELLDVAHECAPQQSSVLSPAQAAPWTVVSDPAEVPGDCRAVLWWAPRATDRGATETWDPAEIAKLADRGIQVSHASSRERMRQAATLNGLRSAESLVCFCPERIAGEVVEPHPAFARIADEVSRREPIMFHGKSVDEVLRDSRISTDVSDLVDGGDTSPAHQASWKFDEAGVPLALVPPEALVAPARATRVIEGDFSHLLPASLSYTQIEALLSDPLEWTLSRSLGLGQSVSPDLPSGNLMLGNFTHALVEALVREGADGDLRTIGSTFDKLEPRFASELLLPGQRARQGAFRAIAVSSVNQLLSSLKDCGVAVIGAETSVDHEWSLTVNGQPFSVQLKGKRDLEAEVVGTGQPVVIDLKWTGSGKRYRSMMDSGEAVQLSIYSATARTESSMAPVTAFYLLKQQEFVSEYPMLDLSSASARGRTESDNVLAPGPALLWSRIEKSVETVLGEISRGVFAAPSADAHAAHSTPPGLSDSRVSAQIKEFKNAREANGELFVEKPQHFSEFNVVYGIAGDWS